MSACSARARKYPKFLSSLELTLFRSDPKIWTPLPMGAELAIAP
ncbi:MAG: hypothetical protein RM049_15140 [Nostoc sp. DedQUE04]|nr:hypothetical protein [Nostoc sp. DedQUE04]